VTALQICCESARGYDPVWQTEVYDALRTGGFGGGAGIGYGGDLDLGVLGNGSWFGGPGSWGNLKNLGPLAPPPATPPPAIPYDPTGISGLVDLLKINAQLTQQEIEELGTLYRTGQTTDKKLKKAGYTEEEIAAIQEEAKKQAAKWNPGGHDWSKIIDSIEGSEKALDDALANLAKDPCSPEAQKAADEAKDLLIELSNAKKIYDIKKRHMER